MAKKRDSKKINIKPKNNLIFWIVLITLTTISITSALILTGTEQKVNTFIPGNISCEVQSDYSIKNTGNASCYIRADVIVNWMDENGNIYAISPEYTITLGTDWEQSADDGYYYYTKEVTEENATTVLISNITTNEEPEGYSLNITVLAEAIQSEDNNKAIEKAWVIDIENIN